MNEIGSRHKREQKLDWIRSNFQNRPRTGTNKSLGYYKINILNVFFISKTITLFLTRLSQGKKKKASHKSRKSVLAAKHFRPRAQNAFAFEKKNPLMISYFCARSKSTFCTFCTFYTAAAFSFCVLLESFISVWEVCSLENTFSFSFSVFRMIRSRHIQSV